jgi:predicted metalloprotease with PDZ domain
MAQIGSRAAGIFIIILLLAGFSTPAQQAAAPRPEISFTVSMPKPYTHLLEVEMRLRHTARLPAQVNLIMPVWAPGSYLIREFERHVQDFQATEAGGRALQWQKTNKNTWRIETGGARELRVTYSVYANELSVRTNHVDDRHANWNNVALLMYPEGHLKAPSTLRIVPFGDWKVATGLPAIAGGQENTFRAENFDELYDSLVEVGKFKTVTFEVRGIPHHIVVDGEGNYDLERMRRDFQKIVEAQVAMMGDVPYKDYTFFIHAHARDDGGLEHSNSTSIIMERFNFRPESRYKGFLGIVSHEFFHVWNVKRIRPDALGPFDYSRENHTKLLWVAEGLTEYYANLMMRRAGLFSDEEYLANLSSGIQTVQTLPGRFEMSVEEASFDAWIKYYRPNENSVNSQISYYDKGQLLGLLLDLEIRKLSNGAKSLDDVMRYLYAEFFKKGRNYTPADFQRAAELMAGSSLEQFFARYVRGRDELDYNAGLSTVGLQLGATPDPTNPAIERPYLGADFTQDGDRLLIRRVYASTPAYDQGLNAGDQIIALDGARVNQQSMQARLMERRPGAILNLTIFRHDDLRTIAIKLGGRVPPDYRVLPIRQPTPDQMRQYRAWIVGSRQ